MTSQGLGLKGLARNIGATFTRQVAAALLGLVTTVMIARVYGPEGNGALAVTLLLPSMLTSFLNLGVAPANVYHLGSRQTTVRRLLAANLQIFLLLGSLGLAIGATVLLWKGSQLFPGVDPRILWFALAIFPLGLLNSYLLSVFQGLQHFRPYNLLAILQPALLLVVIVMVTALGYREFAYLVGAQLIAQFGVFLLTVAWLIPLIEKKPSDVKPEGFVKKTLGYGWKAHLSNILAFINYKADIFLANLFLGPAAVGVYVVAVVLAEKLWLMSQAVSTVILPRLAQLSSDETKRKQLTPLIARWVLLATLIVALMVAAIAMPLVSVLFGPDYLDAVILLWILLPGIVLTSASRVLANDIAARGRPELNMYTSIVVVIVNIVGNLILIPVYGLPGAAAATTAAYIVNLVLRLIMYGYFTKNRWFDSLFIKFTDLQLLRASLTRI